MRTLWKEIGTAFFMGCILPGFLLNLSALLLQGNARQIAQAETAVATQAPEREIFLRLDGESMEMEDYLIGVVLGEMPADFEPDALKAQAVAARTYTAKAMVNGKHGDGSLCRNSNCCQAYIAPEAYLEAGGTEENLKKVRSAVLDTAGQVLTYDGGLIEATYFSCSGGSTEDAVAVWGTDYPYLRAVSSPGEEGATHYQDSLSFDAKTFQEKLGIDLTGGPGSWFGEETRTAGGGVATLSIGGETYSGTTLRKLLNLPSTAFTVTTRGDTILIQTRGYGHRVGMSQYGADAMAVGGSTYDEILQHYYPGTCLESLSDMSLF